MLGVVCCAALSHCNILPEVAEFETKAALAHPVEVLAGTRGSSHGPPPVLRAILPLTALPRCDTFLSLDVTCRVPFPLAGSALIVKIVGIDMVKQGKTYRSNGCLWVGAR